MSPQDAASPSVRMTLQHWIVVGLCVAINVIDGFEILIAGYTAPAISKEYALGPALSGLFLSSSPTGMIVGALFVSPIADFLGRRQLVMMCLMVCIAGMGLMTLTSDLSLIFLARLVTGVGVGAMMVGVNTVAAEAATAERRDLALVLQATGFPLGGALCGLAASLVDLRDWRWIYAAGAVGALLLLIAVIVWLPRRTIAAPVQRGRGHRRFASLTTMGSVMIAMSFFCVMMSFYFLTSWAPKLLSGAGSIKVALSGAALVSVGGVIGDLAFAALMLRWSARRIGPIFAAFAFVFALTLAGSGQHVQLIWPSALLLGFFLYGAMASHYAIVAIVYPTEARASGSGLAVGIGRVGAAAGPAAGGFLLAGGAYQFTTTAILSIPLICCMFLLGMAARRGHCSDANAIT